MILTITIADMANIPTLIQMLSSEGYSASARDYMIDVPFSDESEWDSIISICQPYMPVQTVTWDEVNAKIDRLLSESSWAVQPDAGLTFDKQTEWIDYRDTLRLIPETYTDPNLIIWPEKPL